MLPSRLLGLRSWCLRFCWVLARRFDEELRRKGEGRGVGRKYNSGDF